MGHRILEQVTIETQFRLQDVLANLGAEWRDLVPRGNLDSATTFQLTFFYQIHSYLSEEVDLILFAALHLVCNNWDQVTRAVADKTDAS